MTHINFLFYRLLVSETQTDRHTRQICNRYIYLLQICLVCLSVSLTKSLCEKILTCLLVCLSVSPVAILAQAPGKLTSEKFDVISYVGIDEMCSKTGLGRIWRDLS